LYYLAESSSISISGTTNVEIVFVYLLFYYYNTRCHKMKSIHMHRYTVHSCTVYFFNCSVTKLLPLTLRSHKHVYESGFRLTAHRSFTRTCRTFMVTSTSTQLNACRPYWI